MKIETSRTRELGKALQAERKRQKLSREEAAAVCGVSASFIRDAESAPESCSLGKLVRLINGLGLSLNVAGWPPLQALGRASEQADFGVRDDRIVHSKGEPS
jgi:transcriptional regulator with XRE-family HTH domain